MLVKRKLKEYNRHVFGNIFLEEELENIWKKFKISYKKKAQLQSEP